MIKATAKNKASLRNKLSINQNICQSFIKVKKCMNMFLYKLKYNPQLKT